MRREHGLELVLDYGNRWARGQHISRQSRRFHDSSARSLKISVITVDYSKIIAEGENCQRKTIFDQKRSVFKSLTQSADSTGHPYSSNVTVRIKQARQIMSVIRTEKAVFVIKYPHETFWSNGGTKSFRIWHWFLPTCISSRRRVWYNRALRTSIFWVWNGFSMNKKVHFRWLEIERKYLSFTQVSYLFSSSF